MTWHDVMKPIDPKRDFTYRERCGCKTTFFGESLLHTSLTTACPDHNRRDQTEWRTSFYLRAKAHRDQAARGEF